jgi:hypothetical protein
MRPKQCSYTSCGRKVVYLATPPPPLLRIRQVCIHHAILFHDLGWLVTRLDGRDMRDGELGIRKAQRDGA